jgi:hypothetical protein
MDGHHESRQRVPRGHPTTTYSLFVNRLVAVSPAIGPAYQIGDKVRITFEVEVQINGFSIQASNRALLFPLPRHGQTAYPAAYPEYSADS